MLRQGYEVYVGKYEDIEIDFVAIKPTERVYYQVTRSILDERVEEREKKSLDKPKTLDYLIFKLGQWFREPSDLAEIFLNGKWYVEK